MTKLPHGINIEDSYVEGKNLVFKVRVNKHNPLLWWDLRRALVREFGKQWKHVRITLHVFGRQLELKRPRHGE